jgi:hypothetical protein
VIVTGFGHVQNEDEKSDDSHIATRGYSSQDPIAGVTSLRGYDRARTVVPIVTNANLKRIVEHSQGIRPECWGPSRRFQKQPLSGGRPL